MTADPPGSRPASGAPAQQAGAQPDDRASLESFISRVRAGDSEAFDEIVRRYEGLVLRLARRMTGNREDALDVSQESFLRVYRSLGRFGSGRRFESWVYRIVINASMDLLRRRGGGGRLVSWNEGEGVTSHEDSLASAAPGPEQDALSGQLREKLDGLLGELSPRLRAVFLLRDLEGIATPEIARILGCRDITVRRHSMEARDKMRALLNKRHPGLAPDRRIPKNN